MHIHICSNLFIGVVVHKCVQTHVDREKGQATGQSLGPRELAVRGTSKGR